MEIISDIDIAFGIEEIQTIFLKSFENIKTLHCKYQEEHDVYVKRDSHTVIISYHQQYQVFLALKEVLINAFDFEKTIHAKIDELTYMIDCARGAVPKIETLKKMILNLALLGYQKLGLYIEDVFVIPGEEMFGYMRGSYSKKEIEELVSYARDFGLKIIPYIQTLAHLPHIFKHQVYQDICDIKDILCVGENKTYALIEKMIVSAKDMFQTNEINIGMDEAWQLGLGQYLKKHGYQNRLDIMLSHLKRVEQILDKYQVDASMWADMFFLLKDGSYLLNQHTDFKDIKEKIPQHIKLIYWDYYQKDPKKYAKKMQSLKTLSNDIGFAGGAWKWIGYTPLNAFSIETMTASFEMCVNESINQYILTAWGDNGAEASMFSMLPTIVSLSAINYDQNDQISKILKYLTTYDYSEWMMLDKLNHLYQSNDLFPVNPSKYLLFEDILMGHPKIYVNPSYKDIYQDLSKKLKSLLKRDSTYQYLFKTLYDLANVLINKSTLSLYVFNQYMENSPRKDIVMEIDHVLNKLNTFSSSFKKQWYLENKRFGYEMHSYRLGGLRKRLEDVRDILLTEKKIDELDVRIITEKQSDDPRDGCIYFNQFENYITY